MEGRKIEVFRGKLHTAAKGVLGEEIVVKSKRRNNCM